MTGHLQKQKFINRLFLLFWPAYFFGGLELSPLMPPLCISLINFFDRPPLFDILYLVCAVLLAKFNQMSFWHEASSTTAANVILNTFTTGIRSFPPSQYNPKAITRFLIKCERPTLTLKYCVEKFETNRWQMLEHFWSDPLITQTVFHFQLLFLCPRCFHQIL